MKIITSISGFILLFLVSGCFAPLNSLYDNAKLLEKGEVRLQGNYSKYYGNTFSWDKGMGEGLVNLNNNLGLSLGYGFSEKFNLSFRYEHLNVNNSFELFGVKDTTLFKINYFEAGSKINLKKDKLALGIPVGFYLSEGFLTAVLDPRLFVTFRNNEKFEINIIPKAHIFIGDGVSFIPGLSLGLGLSNNLDNWAIRPEIGVDGNVYFGVGMNINIKKK